MTEYVKMGQEKIVSAFELFKTGALDGDLKIAGFAGQLSRFLEKNYEQSKENDDIPTMVFFLKLAHQLKGFCREEAFFCHTTERLQALVNSEGIEAEVKSLDGRRWQARRNGELLRGAARKS